MRNSSYINASFTLSILLFLTTEGIAKKTEFECPIDEVRLDKKGGPLENVGVSNQGQFGICYAESAALMLTAAAPDHPEISALNLATRHTPEKYMFEDGAVLPEITEESEFFFDGGFPCEILDSALKPDKRRPLGEALLCKKSAVEFESNPDALTPETIGDALSTQKMIALFKQLGLSYKAKDEMLIDMKKLGEKGLSKEEISSLKENHVCPDEQGFFKFLKSWSKQSGQVVQETVLSSLGTEKDLSRPLESILTPKCLDPVNQVKIENPSQYECKRELMPKIESKRPEDLPLVEKKAGSLIFPTLLDPASPLPVGLTVCSSVLSHPKHRSKYGAKCDNRRYGQHAVTAIGARTRAGRCEILVQNSYGTDCAEYENKRPCENGKIWIPLNELGANLVEAAVLKKRTP